jgi:predicted DCC family thiol-disulfide oxidoreductase YuxK
MSGWIVYDADCGLCQTGRRTLGKVFTRRGFEWVPLQTTGTAAWLRISEAELRREMKLLLPDKRVLGGVDALINLLRAVWWLRPLGILLSLPGLHELAKTAYRCIARNRYCVGGRCQAPRPKRRRTIPFLDLP